MSDAAEKKLAPLERVAEEIDRCVKCGTCLGSCPLYRELPVESSSARGKLALVEAAREGDQPATRRLNEILSLCTLCQACAASCPNRVRTDEVILAAREALTDEIGLSAASRAIMRGVVASKRGMNLAARLGHLLTPLAAGKVEGPGGTRALRLALPGAPRGRLIPSIAERSFLDRVAQREIVDAQGARTAFFVGCVIDYVRPGDGENVLRLLEGAGIPVAVPTSQACCGLPALGVGDAGTARRLALENAAAFEATNAERVVTACASCGSCLKEKLPGLFPEGSPERARVQKLADKVVDVSVVLDEALGRGAVEAPEAGGVPITWHAPCHLFRGQGVVAQPKRLLKSLPGASFRPMEGETSCCGLGGTFNLKHYDLSLAIAKHKADRAKEAGARVVVTACPGCIIQLQAGAAARGYDIEVIHLVEALARYGKITETRKTAAG